MQSSSRYSFCCVLVSKTYKENITKLWWMIYAISYFRFFDSKCENKKELCRLFVLSLFHILEATIEYVLYSHSTCRILTFSRSKYKNAKTQRDDKVSTFSHCYIFRIVTFSHFRVPIVHAHGGINSLLSLLLLL
jgi:hypothetical protein